MHLDRMINVLEAVAAAGRAVSGSEVHRVTGLPKPTCYRLLQTLADHGLLDQDEEDGRFALGKRFLRIALMGQTDADLRLAAVPILKNAAIEMREAFFLSRFRNDGVEIVHVEVPEDPKIAFIHPGLGFRPLHACSCSKAIAAFSDPSFQRKILKRRLRAYTTQTKTTADALTSEFESIRKRGYAECVEEVELGISSVAAPVTLAGAGVPVSIGATGSVHRFTADRREEMGEALKGYAAQISASISVSYLDKLAE